MAAVILVISGAISSRALADERQAAEAIYLDVVAPPPCPHEGELRRQIEARTKRVRLSAASSAPRSFIVRIDVSGKVVRGHLVIRDHDGDTSRSVKGDSCKTVMAAIALISALAIDPQASTAPVDALPVAPVLPVDPPPVLPPPPSVSPAPPPPAAPSPTSSPKAVPRDTPLEPSRAWAVSSTLGGGLRTAGLPSAAPAVMTSLLIESPRKDLFALEARLGVFVTGTSLADTGAASARCRLASARADGCPLRLGGDTFSLRPCAAFELGVTSATGERVRDPQSETRVWLAMGAGLRGRARVGERLFAEVEAFALAVTTRDRFSVVTCSMALALASFERLAQKEATSILGSPIARIDQIGTYSCREVAAYPGTVSEHSYANAIDIGRFVLKNGKSVEVLRDFDIGEGTPKKTAGAFLRVVSRRANDEDVFSHVLTPFFNASHNNHFHLDLARYRLDGTRPVSSP